MRQTGWLAMLFAWTPVQAQEIQLAPGEQLEIRADGDLNRDEVDDIAYVSFTDDARSLTVLLSVRHEFDVEFKPEVLALDPAPLGPGTLSYEGNVLKAEDLTGGTTAIAATRRYRYDAQAKRLRLIGLEATLYSRTFAHDGFEASWNLLNGDLITRELHLNQGGGDAAYDPVVERKSKRRVPPVWLSESPDPETVLDEVRAP